MNFIYKVIVFIMPNFKAYTYPPTRAEVEEVLVKECEKGNPVARKIGLFNSYLNK